MNAFAIGLIRKRMVVQLTTSSFALVSGFASGASAAPQAMLDYRVTPSVTYGKGAITRGNEKIDRDLWMDVYEPLAETDVQRPAVIMTFGGAYHRGSPRHTFHDGGAQDTSMGDYCSKFAVRGYVCFAIDYRLAPERPIPSRLGYKDADLNMTGVVVMLNRINMIRQIMGLKPIDPGDPEGTQVIVDAVLSATEDLRTAIDHVRDSAEEYVVDPERIVLGGFSAGAVTSLAVAHDMQTPIAGAFLLSGANILKSVEASRNSPPILLFQGQNDLNAAIVGTPALLRHYETVGAPYTFSWVPSFGHFYPAGAVSLSGDGSKMSIEERIAQFLRETIGE